MKGNMNEKEKALSKSNNQTLTASIERIIHYQSNELSRKK